MHLIAPLDKNQLLFSLAFTVLVGAIARKVRVVCIFAVSFFLFVWKAKGNYTGNYQNLLNETRGQQDL